MPSWLPPTFVQHPQRPWSVDASSMGVTPEQLDALGWSTAFDEMQALEQGAIANADEKRQVGHYWLRAPELAPTVGQARQIGETIEAVRAFADAVRSGREKAEDGLPYTDLIHIGIGGSALGPQLLVDALCSPREQKQDESHWGGGLKIHFLDNTDPDGIACTLARVGWRLRHTLVLVVSKSGGTPETRNGMLLVQEACKKHGLDVASRMIAITGEGSALDQQARQEGWRRVFPLWDWVGGRTSITSTVGLLPAELAGVDTTAFLAGARAMDEWTRNASTGTADASAGGWRDNPAALLAGCWHLAGNGRGERAMVVLPYSDRLLLLSRYLQQLVMESLGKRLDRQGRDVLQGLVVYGNKGSTDQHAYVQQLRDGRADFFATFVEVLEDGAGSPLDVDTAVNAGDYLQGFLLGTREALRDSGRPSLTITVPRVDPYVLGGLVALFERAVGLYASLIDVNAYHQPGVEAGKKAAAKILDLSRRIRDGLATPQDVPTLAKALNADPIVVLHLCERLVATGRLSRDGDVPDGVYRKRRGSE